MAALRSQFRCIKEFGPVTNTQWRSLPMRTRSSTASTRSITTTSTRPNELSTYDAENPMRDFEQDAAAHAPHVRPRPASASYFSQTPGFDDKSIVLKELERTYGHLPTITSAQAQRVAWKSKKQYRMEVGEPVKGKLYAQNLMLVKRLHRIHPDLKPEAVKEGLQPFMRAINPFAIRENPPQIDAFGRALGTGRRKTSVARAWVVEGTGEVLVNGKPLNEVFGRIHDRESALWALKISERIDKYNVWALVEGGGTTGQAEAITMAIAKGLCEHEPSLKTPLRRAGCITRDPRAVERKKPGRKKARKGQTWVAR